MHGMLSAAVILAAFAVIALASGTSAAWLFRAAAATPRRSDPARLTGMPAASPAPDPPGAPDDETDAAAAYPERSQPGAGLATPGQPAGPAVYDGPPFPGNPGPGDPAEPPGAGDEYGAYDVENWPGGDDSREGYGGNGPSSPGPRPWPDTAKSLYSRGWPVMDGSPYPREPRQAGNGTENGTENGSAGEPDAAPEPGAPGHPEGARVYVLDESRRPGR